jgi:di/tricarboxylate transporter
VVLSPYQAIWSDPAGDRICERYGLTVLAVWRKGVVTRSGLRDLRLQIGDALLLFGDWKRLALLAGKRISCAHENIQEPARDDKAKIAQPSWGWCSRRLFWDGCRSILRW